MDKYKRMYKRIFKIMGDLTPIKADCGGLCDRACCKGDENTGMLLFPYEESVFNIKSTLSGGRLAVCNGVCERNKRPLACRIFPFFPAVDEKGKITVKTDLRAKRLCPLIMCADEVAFDKRFFSAVKKVGKILYKDDACRAFLYQIAEESEIYGAFLK